MILSAHFYPIFIWMLSLFIFYYVLFVIL